MKKIFILLGNPVTNSLTGHFASVYEAAARAAGHEVKRANLQDLKFDPILHQGYRVIQELEPDLKQVQEDIRWCDHLVIMYPDWWSTMPALFKGFFDRTWLPAFAFRFRKDGWGWNRLLAGKTARVVVTSKTQPWQIRFLFGDYTNELERGILRFSGFKVKRTAIGGAESLTPAQVSKWERKIASLGSRGK